MSVTEEYEELLALLFDRSRRAAWTADPGSARAPSLRTVDARGLALDADMREGYLMASLCRSFPTATACVGSTPEGRAHLRAFLATPALFVSLGQRIAAFGRHLEAGLGLVPEVARPLVASFLGLERARAENAAAMRAAVAAGKHVAPPTKPTGGAIKRGKLVLPPYLLVAELPVPTGIIATALHHVTPETAWRLIHAGDLSMDRVVSVARGDAAPVTVVCRGVVKADEPSHVVVELSGRRGALFARLDGTTTLADLPAGERRLARALLDGGFLDTR